MLRRQCLILLAFALPAFTAILPAEFAGKQRTGQTNIELSDRPVWEEYGLEQTERAAYGSVGIAAYRFKDATGAFAGLQWLRGDEAIAGRLAQYGNYVLHFEGTKPSEDDVRRLGAALPNVRQSSLPSLRTYLPTGRKIASSERLLLGPVSLGKFEPRLPADLLGFQKGAEAIAARYRQGTKELQLVVVSYPTPQIAQERLKAFQSSPEFLVRREGPMLAVIPHPVDPAFSKTVLESMHYDPNLTWNEKIPEDPRKVADMLTSIGIITVVLILGSVLLGFALGGLRRIGARLGISSGDDTFTSLHLEQ